MTYEEATKHINVVKSRIRGGDEAYDIQRKEALNIAIKALEKQIAKKPLRGRCGTLCPSCHRLEYIVRRDALDTHCGFCGQAIDWSDDEET